MLWQRKEANGHEVYWPLLWAVSFSTDAHQEAGAQVRKMAEDLRLEKDMGLEKDMYLSTVLLASALADKLEEQDDKLDKLLCYFFFCKARRT